jgi:hypothetical protein
MKQPPKDKKEAQKQKIIGETAPDKSLSEKEVENNSEPKQERTEKNDHDKEELTNMDQKITNTDEKHDTENIAL